MELPKRRILMNAFFKSQFNYCPAIGMFHSRTLNNKINRLHERSLRITYNDKLSNFEELLHKDNSVCIHHNNIHALAVEMYKVANGTSPDIIKQRSNSQYNLRHTSQFFVNPIHSVYDGSASASYLGQTFGSKYLLKFEIRSPLKILSKRSRNGNQLTVLVEFVKSLYQTWGSYKLHR